MKKIRFLVLIFYCSPLFSATGVCFEPIINKVDSLVMADSYKEIAYYTYLHRRKRDYIAKSYALIAEMRKIGTQTLGAGSSNVSTIGNSPMLQVGILESNIIAISNKVNLALLEHVIYRDIKKEISLMYQGENDEKQ